MKFCAANIFNLFLVYNQIDLELDKKTHRRKKKEHILNIFFEWNQETT